MGRGAFGVHSGPETPHTCRVTGLHLLHRHGARYPTAWGEGILFWSACATLNWRHSVVRRPCRSTWPS
jgi:hypothetical protein